MKNNIFDWLIETAHGVSFRFPFYATVDNFICAGLNSMLTASSWALENIKMIYATSCNNEDIFNESFNQDKRNETISYSAVALSSFIYSQQLWEFIPHKFHFLVNPQILFLFTIVSCTTYVLVSCFCIPLGGYFSDFTITSILSQFQLLCVSL